MNPPHHINTNQRTVAPAAAGAAGPRRRGGLSIDSRMWVHTDESEPTYLNDPASSHPTTYRAAARGASRGSRGAPWWGAPAPAYTYGVVCQICEGYPMPSPLHQRTWRARAPSKKRSASPPSSHASQPECALTCTGPRSIAYRRLYVVHVRVSSIHPSIMIKTKSEFSYLAELLLQLGQVLGHGLVVVARGGALVVLLA